MILAAEGKLLIEFSIVQGKLVEQSHRVSNYLDLLVNE